MQTVLLFGRGQVGPHGGGVIPEDGTVDPGGSFVVDFVDEGAEFAIFVLGTSNVGVGGEEAIEPDVADVESLDPSGPTTATHGGNPLDGGFGLVGVFPQDLLRVHHLKGDGVGVRKFHKGIRRGRLADVVRNARYILRRVLFD